MKDKKNIIYISYNGILEPLGQSQILSYLENLSNHFNFYIFSFEEKKKFKSRII